MNITPILKDVLSSGKALKVAVAVFAAGDGTRLGANSSKALFVLPTIKKTLVELMMQRLLYIKKMTQLDIHVAFMVNPLYKKRIEQLFEKNSFFSFPIEKIDFFTQPLLPVLGSDKCPTMIGVFCVQVLMVMALFMKL